jgi:hypothetical protein
MSMSCLVWHEISSRGALKLLVGANQRQLLSDVVQHDRKATIPALFICVGFLRPTVAGEHQPTCFYAKMEAL